MTLCVLMEATALSGRTVVAAAGSFDPGGKGGERPQDVIFSFSDGSRLL